MNYKEFKYFRVTGKDIQAHIAIKEEQVEVLDLAPEEEMTPELFCDLVDQVLEE